MAEQDNSGLNNLIKSKEQIKEIMKPIEANVVGLLWQNPNLYFDYPELDKNIFKNSIWIFYFDIGKKLAYKNIKKIDDVAVETYLQKNEKAIDTYKKFGGYDTIENLQFYLTTENVDAYINELKKWSSVYNVVTNFTLTEKQIEQLKDMNLNEAYDYYTAILNNVYINTEDEGEASNMDEEIDEIINEADEGLNIGMPIMSPILNDEIGGSMDGQIMLVGGLSGTGKTTFTINVLLASLFENEEPAVIMLNEQDHKKWKQELLTWIINNKINKEEHKWFNKKRWREGHFTDEEKLWLKEASAYLKEKMQNNKIILYHFKSYSCKKALRIIKKYSALGIKKFVLDTFKLSSERGNNDTFWLSMQEDMRQFDDLIKPSNLNVNLWVTLQLQKGSVLKRYLTGDSIGMAKNVIDVASVGLLMRRVRNDEYSGGKYEIEVKKPIKGTSSGVSVTLDPKKKYVLIFIEKNRNGESQNYQIVAEHLLGTLVYKEVGICDIPFDS